jgi:hypothetical protein
VNRSRLYNIALCLIPVLCLCLAGAIDLYQLHHLRQLQQDWAHAGRQIADLASLTDAETMHPHLSKLPTAEQSAREQPTFLNSLRAYAEESHVKLVRWAGVSTPLPVAGDNNGKPADTGMPPDVTAIASTVEVAGQYNNLRHFLYDLLRSPRLLNMTDIKWMRDETWPQTHLTFTLTRYVAPADKAAIHDTEIKVEPAVQTPKTGPAPDSQTTTVSQPATPAAPTTPPAPAGKL